MARNRIARILRPSKVASKRSTSILGTKFPRPPHRSRKVSHSTPDDNALERPPAKSGSAPFRDPIETLYLYSLPIRIRTAEQDQDRIAAKVLGKLNRNVQDLQDLIRARARVAFLQAEHDALVYHRKEHDTRPMREVCLGQLALEREAREKRWKYAELVASAPLLRYGADRRLLARLGAITWIVMSLPRVGSCKIVLWLQDSGRMESALKWMFPLRNWRRG